MTTVDRIVTAIAEKKSLAFAYHGFDRVVSPYACGLSPTNEIKLIAFQTAGGSNSGVTEKLRFYTVADIAGIAESEQVYREVTDSDKETFVQLVNVYERVE